MRISLSDEQQQFQDWAKKFAESCVKPHVERHQTERIQPELLKELSSQGWMALTVPETEGGGGLDPLSFSVCIRELSRVCASTAITVAVTNMIAETLARDGTAAQKKKFLSSIVSGSSLTASFCLTENSSGSDAAALRTRAEKKSRHYVLNGEKIYVTNGAYSGVFLVMARTSETPGAQGISAFIVERDQKGLHLGKEEDKMGLTASSTIQLSLDQVEVPEENRLLEEGEGFKIAMRSLDSGRISVASQSLGTAEAALAAGLRYVKEREQFGKTLSEFQAIQWKLANAATELSAAELLIAKACDLKRKGRSYTRAASMAKLFATESATRVCNEMIQIFGGYGYIKEYPVERFYRDVRVTKLYEGTSEIQRLVIAKDLLKGAEL
ncbi:MAG: acyl-CoA dehydrogenase [Bradymonadales bacterium]|nr:MAG: acyl-CoA dehydrogenase [Bradymonadales bacterium]